MKIKWTNRDSGDTGFVKKVNPDKQDFVNTFDEKEAANYSPNKVNDYIAALSASQPQNDYTAIAVEPKPVPKTAKTAKKAVKARAKTKKAEKTVKPAETTDA